MPIQSIVRFLVPNEGRFYDFLEQQGQLALEGAQALSRFAREKVPPEEVREAVQAVEHRGDAVVHEMEETLARTFVTPIDREDLKKLSDELDDVLDLTNGAARVCVLMGIDTPTQPMLDLISQLVASTEVLARAVPHLRKHEYQELVEASRTLRKIEKESDRIYRDAIRRLFHDPAVDAKTLLREKEMLDDLETAIDRCEHAGETMAHLAIKHG
ncbi:DUF47 family protein [Myxococcota bacterium]|jgi:uncharacterized protein Yka (UPF0111/DUF47 family)|nr:DUF47 family protein [Myxococcota bacterium]